MQSRDHDTYQARAIGEPTVEDHWPGHVSQCVQHSTEDIGPRCWIPDGESSTSAGSTRASQRSSISSSNTLVVLRLLVAEASEPLFLRGMEIAADVKKNSRRNALALYATLEEFKADTVRVKFRESIAECELGLFPCRLERTNSERGCHTTANMWLVLIWKLPLITCAIPFPSQNGRECSTLDC